MDLNENRIAFLIPNYNSTDYLINCIKSIITYCDFSKLDKEIIVIDDFSNKEEINKLNDFFLNPPEYIKEEIYTKIKFNFLKENKGVGNAFNEAMSWSNAKYFIRLDSDTEVVVKDFDEKLIKFLEEDRELGLITCRTGTIGQPLQRVKIPDFFIENNKEEEYMLGLEVPNLTYCSQPNEVLSGFCFGFRKEDLIKHNIIFNTEMKMYGEDGIFHFDILEAGLKAAIANKLYLWHKHHGTVGNISQDIVDQERKKALEVWTTYLEKRKKD